MPQKRCRKALRVIGGGFFGLLLGAGLYLGGLQLTGNFHTVIPGTLYRSAQPSAADISKYHQAYGIKTIVNLRGEHTGKGWYEAEVAEADRLGIDHVDFYMSASLELSQEKAAELLLVFERAERPVLIHCKAGADRSGLAAALYLAAVTKHGEEAAEEQISLRYGHVSIPFAGAFAMDETFEVLEPWLGFPDS
ncbi:tyrosine-protein phosphatase [Nisaea sp.]|uniref:tyrosine-protein phosphatase n=1 Tax=Nisaea sp. TaxID=2024842 RepID=UPI002B274E58|nr:tyrosine-protein phosphatase [Nisaea sp.]